MKKIIISLLILALLLPGCGKQEARETMAPTDAPQITEEAEIPEDQEAVTKPPAETETITVTRQVRMAALNEDGEERWYREYTYDELGRLATEQEIISATGEQTYFAAVTYTGTDDGQEICYTDAEGRVTISRETLDSKGNVIRRESLWEGEVDYYTEYTYDENGNLLSEQTHYSEDPAVPRTEYTYDDQGNRTAVHEYDGQELTGWQQMTYDADGRCTETLSYGFDGELVSRTEHSWEGNTEIRSRMDPDGTVYMVILVTYDEAGNLLRQETQQEGYVISCTEYTYQQFLIPAP